MTEVVRVMTAVLLVGSSNESGARFNSISYAPDNIPSALGAWTPTRSVCRDAALPGCCGYNDEQTEKQWNEISCPESHSWPLAELASVPRLSNPVL